MKWGAGWILLCVILTILRVVLLAIAIMGVVALLFCFIAKPRETLEFIGVIVITALASAHPAVFTVTLGIVVIMLAKIGIGRKRLIPSTPNGSLESD